MIVKAVRHLEKKSKFLRDHFTCNFEMIDGHSKFIICFVLGLTTLACFDPIKVSSVPFPGCLPYFGK